MLLAFSDTNMVLSRIVVYACNLIPFVENRSDSTPHLLLNTLYLEFK